jgi:hypothetical protein
MPQWLFSFVVPASLALLCACGGGGGSAGGGGVGPPGPAPTPPNGPAVVTGKLVDDTTGLALGGVNVGLAPWIADALPIPQGTTAPDGSFGFTATPGHYLLVIGTNVATDTTRATIHDNVTLVSGAQTLEAPVLPPWPTVTPPPWETNGDYRLQTIDPVKELPCFQSYNSQRTAMSLTPVVEDEWLKENTRDQTAWHDSGHYGDPAYPQTAASHFYTNGNAFTVGGTSCSDVTGAAFSGGALPYSTSTHNLWFGGLYYFWTPPSPAVGSQGAGISEFPLDPRFAADPSGYVWP